MTDAAPYLRLERITKSFGSFQALKDVSLEIFGGEFVCFLGPSGCGKTTLLRAIAGLDVQTSGRIEQGGRDVSDLPASARDFGIVFQSYALFPNLTVARNVGYGLESRRIPRAERTRRVADLLELVGLPDAGPKFPGQLSGGQQQRVALARALAIGPGLLLLDEPLSALDARVRQRLRAEIVRLHRRLGITTIMVTHDQEEALTMADRIVVMNQGGIEQVGTPLTIYRHPASRFVADFIGHMNFIPALTAGPGRVRVGALELETGELDDLPPGTPVTLGVRPEDIQVRNIGGQAANVFSAHVGELEFLGGIWRAALTERAEGAGPVLELRADLSSNAVRDLDVARGAELMVAVPPERIRVFVQGAAP
jgi:iron(III) transport system ATP-binding protein